MKKVFLLVSVLLFIFASLTFGKTKVIILADESYPPYSFKDKKNKITGIYINILNNAFSHPSLQDYQVRIKSVPWKRGLNQIEKGKAFALVPPYHRFESRPYFWPYSLPILAEKLVVFCHKDVFRNNPRKNWIKDYLGLKFGRNPAFAVGDEQFNKALKAGKIRIEDSKGNRENILKLGLKRIDCYINDRLSILYELKRMKKAGEYNEGGRHAKILEGATVTFESGFVGYTDRDNGRFTYKRDFVQKLDNVIYKMQRDGSINKIVDDFVK